MVVAAALSVVAGVDVVGAAAAGAGGAAAFGADDVGLGLGGDGGDTATGTAIVSGCSKFQSTLERE